VDPGLDLGLDHEDERLGYSSVTKSCLAAARHATRTPDVAGHRRQEVPQNPLSGWVVDQEQ
jgi:hypothetical protein